MSYYEKIGPELLRRERGVHDWPDDKGGITAHGITRPTAEKYGIDIFSIDEEMAVKIYKMEFYDPHRLDEMPEISIAWRIAVDGVHSGTHRVVKRLQVLCNLHLEDKIAIDGVLGPATVKATRNAIYPIASSVQASRGGLLIPAPWEDGVKELCLQLKALQFGHYYNICKNNPSQMKWWKGWLNRIRKEPDFYLQ